MATNRASTVQDIQVNAAATVLAECGHYALQQAWGKPAVNWHSTSPIWKQTLIEHAAYFLERLKPIAKRPHMAMVKAPARSAAVSAVSSVEGWHASVPNAGDSGSYLQAPAPSLANSGDDRGEGEKPCGPSGGDLSGDFLIEPEACLYCGCVIEEEGREPYCSALCSISAENDR